MGEPRGRLISFGGLLADLVVSLEALPTRGADVLASAFSQTLGGGFAVIAAAARLGVPTALAGVLGDDPIADTARQILSDEGIELLLPEPRAGTSGFCLVLVDADGERTMVTVQGTESRVQSEDFDAVIADPGDAVYVNGYELLYPHAPGLLGWLRRVRPDHLVFDPGPLIATIDPASLGEILGATCWLSLNAAEATVLTGKREPRAAAAAALDRIRTAAAVDGPKSAGMEDPSARRRRGVVVRVGGEGCVVVEAGMEPRRVPAVPVEAVDTTGAGDTHVGAFIAALARGLDPVEACRWANAAAAHVVASRGQVSPPRLGELREILAASA